MSNGMQRGVTLVLFWSVIAGVIVLGGYVADYRDKVHTREIKVIREDVNIMRSDWREDQKAINTKLDAIIARLPAKTE